MTNKMQKEQFSRAYVQAVAACAGFSWSVPSVDDDSEDMILGRTGGTGTIRSPKLSLQLKCTSALTPTEDPFPFDIKIKNYDDLRDETVPIPRILVVVIVPDDVGDWLAHSEAEMVLRRCGYWVSLRALPTTPNTANITVEIPRTQTLTVQSLKEMMERIGSGALP